MKKLLPFTKYPLMRALQFHAFMSGMITANNSQNALHWLLSYSIRVLNTEFTFCICYPGDCPILLREISYTNKDCFDRKNLNLEGYLNEENMEEICKHIIKMINDKYYVYGEFDEFYIPSKYSFHKKHFIHDYLLIGYDTDKRIFYFAGYNTTGVFDINEISFGDFYKGVLSAMKKNKTNINFYRVKTKFKFDFKYDIFKNLLIEFYESKETSIYNLDDCLYGYKALNEFANYMNLDFANENSFLFMRNLRSFCEHEIILYKTIDYLQTTGWLSKYICLDIEKKITDIKALLNLGIKFSVTNSQSIPNRIAKIINQQILFEKHFIEEIYTMVKTDVS